MSNNGNGTIFYDEKPPAPPIRFSSSSSSSSTTTNITTNNNILSLNLPYYSTKNQLDKFKNSAAVAAANNDRIYCSGRQTGVSVKQMSKPLPHEPDYNTSSNGGGFGGNCAGGFGSVGNKKSTKKSKMSFGKSN